MVVLAASVGACSFVTSLDGLSGGDGQSPGSAGDDAAAGPSEAASPATSEAASPSDASEAAIDAGLPGPCPDAGILCNGACVDPTRDPSNCNGCGNVCTSGLCGTGLAATLTSLPAGWTFNGSAAYNASAPSAELTAPAVNGQAGTFLYQHAVLVDGLDVTFQFRIGLQGGLRSDGMGFLIEQSGPTSVGRAGGGLGMAGLPGFGVELDIYDNGLCGDSSGDQVGLDDLTICDAKNGLPTSLFALDVTPQLDLGDTHWHSAEITLASGAVTLVVDGATLFSGISLPAFDASAAYYLGFAGGTGGLVGADGGPGGYRQEVKDVAIAFSTPRCL